MDVMSQPEPDEKFEELLEFLQRSRGFDFKCYKRASLVRRVRKRMQMIALDDYESYKDYLEVHTEEFDFLFNTILINVTSFFRDASAWDFLAREVIPKILAQKKTKRLCGFGASVVLREKRPTPSPCLWPK